MNNNNQSPITKHQTILNNQSPSTNHQTNSNYQFSKLQTDSRLTIAFRLVIEIWLLMIVFLSGICNLIIGYSYLRWCH